MNLAIDIGNSYIKIGRFQAGELIEKKQPKNYSELVLYLEGISPDRVIISSVRARLENELKSLFADSDLTVLSKDTPLPFKLDYKTPETLGVDRIAAVAGALVVNPDSPSMVIDAGTCITYDLINNEKVFVGGIISPGLKIRFKAMHEYTGNLPLIEVEDQSEIAPLVGKSTHEAMKSGVINGIKWEMDSFIEEYRRLYPDLNVLLCGGEAKYFESRLKAHIFVVPDLVLIGLNRILEYNE